jgi:alpha-D-ribose 1-methylphosphonate 5-triphosphate diphosphatase
MIDGARIDTLERTTYTNVRLQMPSGEIAGTLVVENGRIVDIASGRTRSGIDLGGVICMPGLVELHTDNIETVLAPRPGVRWPLELAVAFHDRSVVSAGITTVCDAVALGDALPGSTRPQVEAQIVDAVVRGVAGGRFAADHFLHLRCELVYDELVNVVRRFIDEPRVVLLSVMDHTPGQRQFADLRKFEQYYAGRHGLDAAGVERMVAARRRDQELHAAANRDAVVALARERGIPLATHDDANADHIAEARREGAVIAEFPTSREAARAARDVGMAVLMGSPNIVLGGSQSGNVSALELACDGLVDIFSSDYVLQSLLHAPFAVAAATGTPLHRTMRSVTVTPARAIGLDDRGELALGQRADLIFVDASGANVRVVGVIRNGKRVA